MQIKRRSRSYTGRLVYRLTEGESPNPLWLVTFDSGNVKDEEIYEKHFGKILRKGGRVTKVPGGTGGTGDKSRRSRTSGGRPNISTPSINRNGSSKVIGVNDEQTSNSGDPGECQDRHVKEQEVVEENTGNVGRATEEHRSKRPSRESGNGSNGEGVNSEKDDSSGNNNNSNLVDPTPLPQSKPEPGGKRSAREQRSLRRQAKIDEDAVVVDKRKRGSSSVAESDDNDLKRSRSSKDAGEEVIKVKLNTGTLYLYRGLKRRAVFVRRY